MASFNFSILLETPPKILISVLIENEFITDEDNDEIVLECIIIRDLKKMDVDISNSQGLYYFRGGFFN